MAESLILSGLYIYPIKSAAGLTLETATVEARGLGGDRRYMVTDPQGKFMTQRKHPRMALIQVDLIQANSGQTLSLTAPGMSSLDVAVSNEAVSNKAVSNEAEVEVEVWGDRTTAHPCGPAAATWLSDFLQTPCQLVYMPDHAQRPTAHGKLGADKLVSFADAYPFLLISEASLADLNSKLAQPVPMNRFRPNLVVKGCEAFAEDTWKRIRIGEIEFEVSKGCDRCSVPGVDQATGVQVREPMPTLAKYRLWDGKIWFGQNLIQRGLGQLCLGNRVEILELL